MPGRILPLLAAVALAGCAGLGEGGNMPGANAPRASAPGVAAHIAVPTQQPGSAGICMDALAHGRLAADDEWGMALERGGRARQVLWPHGYYATLDGGRLALHDADGRIVAHQGDLVMLHGGWRGGEDDAAVFQTCEVLEATTPSP